MAKAEVTMAIDPMRVVKRALSYCEKGLGLRKVIAVDFDEEADILYVKFKHSKIVDTEPLDRKGLVAASLDDNKGIVGLVITEAFEVQPIVQLTIVHLASANFLP